MIGVEGQVQRLEAQVQPDPQDQAQRKAADERPRAADRRDLVGQPVPIAPVVGQQRLVQTRGRLGGDQVDDALLHLRQPAIGGGQQVAGQLVEALIGGHGRSSVKV
jgi:hypothetical protein